MRVKVLRDVDSVEVMLGFILVRQYFNVIGATGHTAGLPFPKQFKDDMRKFCELIHPNLVQMRGWTLSIVDEKHLRAQLISKSCRDIKTYSDLHPNADRRIWVIF